MFEKLRVMFGGKEAPRMKDPAVERAAAARAARKQRREASAPEVRVVRPGEAHRRENKFGQRESGGAGPAAKSGVSKTYDVSHLGKATPEQLEKAMKKIEQAAQEDEAAA